MACTKLGFTGVSTKEAMLLRCEDTVIFQKSNDAGIHNVFKDFGTN